MLAPQRRCAYGGPRELRHPGQARSRAAPYSSNRRLAAAAALRTSSSTASAPGRQIRTLPNISYSTAKADIGLAELRLLYQQVHAASAVPGSPTTRAFFQHWQHLSESDDDGKLRLLLDKSVAVVAAFTRDPRFASDEAQGAAGGEDAGGASGGGGEPSTSGRQGDGSAAPWQLWGWRRPRRRLVGFVRAAGDDALVATVHDLLVHPDLQGFGLGSRLLHRLVHQVTSSGLYDVGLVSPSTLGSFFRSCSFDLDREESVPMVLRAGWQDGGGRGEDAAAAALQDNPALQKLLATALDDEQRRLFGGAGLRGG